MSDPCLPKPRTSCTLFAASITCICKPIPTTYDVLYVPEENEKVRGYVRQTKMIMIDDPVRLDGIKPQLVRLLGPEVHVTKSKEHYLEVLHREGTKGHAPKFLANLYGIPLEETDAVGDAWNGREMIEAAGLGAAMANAIPALQEIADYVTLSNHEDGVRHVLEKFVLQP